MGVVGALTALATRGLGAPAAAQADPGAALAAASALLNLLKEPAAAQRLARNELGMSGLVAGLQARPPCRCFSFSGTSLVTCGGAWRTTFREVRLLWLLPATCSCRHVCELPA